MAVALPAYDHGRPPISSYNIGDTWAPSYTNTHGEGMAPKQESHADFFAPTLEAHGNTGAPALNVGDTPTPKLEGTNISLLLNKRHMLI